MLSLDQTQSPETTAAFDLSDRGLLLGDGIFETAMVLNSQILLLERHMDRLLAGAAALAIPITPDRVRRAGEAVCDSVSAGILRITLTRGPGGHGLSGGGQSVHPTLLAHCIPLDAARLFAPVKFGVSTIRRNPASPISRYKTLCYLDNVLAAREVAAHGCDIGVMLNTGGQVACADSGNIWVMNGDQLCTPPVEDGALAGTVRAWIIENGAMFGYDVEINSLSLHDLKAADAVFLTNSLRLIAPVTALDGEGLGSARPMRLARGLVNQFVQEVGPSPVFSALENFK